MPTSASKGIGRPTRRAAARGVLCTRSGPARPQRAPTPAACSCPEARARSQPRAGRTVHS
eukprot:1377641-Prymnesium_polylepis.1